MSAPIWSVGYLLLILLAGYAASSLILKGKGRSIFELFPLSFGLGTGLVGCLLFWLSLAGLKPGRLLLLILGCLSGIALLALSLRRRLILHAPSGTLNLFFRRPFELALIALIVLLSLVVAIHCLAFPLYEWDAFAIWGFKAKVLFNEGVSHSTYFQDISKSFSHLDYPLLFPFLTAGAYGMMGGVYEKSGKLLLLFFYISLLMLTFSAVRAKLSLRQSLFLTFILGSVPALLRFAGSGYAGTIFAFYLAASVIYLCRWIESEGFSDLLISSLFSAFSLFAKNEGFALVFITAVLLCAWSLVGRRRRRLLGLSIYVGSIFAISLPWLLFMHALPKTHENYAARIRLEIIMGSLERLGVIIPDFFRQLWYFNAWGGLWVLLVIAAVVGWKAFREAPVVILWLIFLMQAAAYIFAYLITPWDVKELLAVSLVRLVLHIVPLAILLIGYHWKASNASLLA